MWKSTTHLHSRLSSLTKVGICAAWVLASATTPANADDLSYIDNRFPDAQLTGDARLRRAAECTLEGDGRCYMQVVAAILRNFRHRSTPDPILEQYKLGYFVNAVNRWHYNIKGKRDPYVYLSSAIYYGHKGIANGDCNLDDSFGFNGPLSDLDNVDVSQCDTASCRADVTYFVRGFQDHYREKCL